MVGVAIELTCCYHSELPVRSAGQRHLLTDAQLLVDPAEVSSWENTYRTVTVVLSMVKRVCLDVHCLQVTVKLTVLSKENNCIGK